MTDNENFQSLQAARISRCLCMDTATSEMTVAILENGKLRGEISTHAERNHSIGLLPNIQELLSSLGLSAKDLQAVIVGNGPGSYTGVRIGVTVAKTFAWSLGMDLIGVSSLEAMALGGRRSFLGQADSDRDLRQVNELSELKELNDLSELNELSQLNQLNQLNQEDGTASYSVQWIIPLMDARRTQAFTGIYEAKGSWHPQAYMLRDKPVSMADASIIQAAQEGHALHSDDSWRQLVPDGIHLIQPWLEQIETMALDQKFREKLTGIEGLEAPDNIIFVGETAGFEPILTSFLQRLGSRIHIVPHLVEAYDIGLLGIAKLYAGEREEVHTFVPNYAQLPEAEVNYLAAKAQMQEKKGAD